MSGKKVGHGPSTPSKASKGNTTRALAGGRAENAPGTNKDKALPLKQKRQQQFQRGGRPVRSELTLIEEIVELSANELILGDDTGEFDQPKPAKKVKIPPIHRSPVDPDAIRSKSSPKKTRTQRTLPPKQEDLTPLPEFRKASDNQSPEPLMGPASAHASERSRPPSPTTPLPRPARLKRRTKKSSPLLDTGIGLNLQPHLTETASHFLFPEESLSPSMAAVAPTQGPDTSPELVASGLPDLMATRPDVEAISMPQAPAHNHADTMDDLTSLTEEDAITFSESIPTAVPLSLPPAELTVEERLQRIDLARQNYEVLRHHLHTNSVDQLCLDDSGRLATSAASAATIVVPQSHNGQLISFCVPTGLAKDEEGQLCEAYLVLRKLPNEAPVWSHALASLQATEHRSLHFVEWSPVKEEMLYLLNDDQREHLLYLLAPEFSSILQDPLYPPDEKKGPQPLKIKAKTTPQQRPQQLKSSPNRQQAAPSRAKPNSKKEIPGVMGQDGIIDLTKPSGKRSSRIFDDTALRRIQVKTAPLNPDALRLHINIPGSLHGKGFQPIEQILRTHGDHRELKLPLLGLKIEFTYNKGASGKVFPRIIVTRSTNVRGIQYAAYEIGLFANRNPREEDGFDHVQELPRGHLASIDLSPTDQLRGVMLLTVAPPQSATYSETIHCSWSVAD